MSRSIWCKTFSSFKNNVWKYTHKDAAAMLITMGAFGFILGSLAQCWAIKTNDRLDNKKKNFMLAQEASDGAVNVGLYLLITSGVWKLSDKLLKMSGLCNFSKKSLRSIIFKSNSKSHLRSGARILTTMVASVLACNIITPLIRNVIAGKFRAYSDAKEQFNDMLSLTVKKNNSLSDNAFTTFNRLNYYPVKNLPKCNCITSNAGMLKI